MKADLSLFGNARSVTRVAARTVRASCPVGAQDMSETSRSRAEEETTRAKIPTGSSKSREMKVLKRGEGSAGSPRQGLRSRRTPKEVNWKVSLKWLEVYESWFTKHPVAS
ncbi:uncharacterized protein PHALS_09578 [Plasmopara halstedii]|uniref:Uncharacterized protein n=1 Tax=Plasmopara halstedii TaxID=4781 RepID=A0A0P1AEQ2_PLAHL|nr:uncharacterized protein PHALS_09578 [Plasmopara halstedii]CEG39324.1 hypothetical protein PHALS_09578 [Plasmopara halstedii]|eukprot:XP_024575693.1 hypothetical protein PHALS_09578 [Plasmopara halstedii]